MAILTDNPLFLALELADGQLTVRDAYELPLRCGLVTLSACETGVNDIAPGNELIGLARGFISAGAPTLIMSLWAVDDASTAQTMALLYANLRAGQGPAAALRQAQRAIRAEYAHPFSTGRHFCAAGALVTFFSFFQLALNKFCMFSYNQRNTTLKQFSRCHISARQAAWALGSVMKSARTMLARINSAHISGSTRNMDMRPTRRFRHVFAAAALLLAALVSAGPASAHLRRGRYATDELLVRLQPSANPRAFAQANGLKLSADARDALPDQAIYR